MEMFNVIIILVILLIFGICDMSLILMSDMLYNTSRRSYKASTTCTRSVTSSTRTSNQRTFSYVSTRPPSNRWPSTPPSGRKNQQRNSRDQQVGIPWAPQVAPLEVTSRFSFWSTISLVRSFCELHVKSINYFMIGVYIGDECYNS